MEKYEPTKVLWMARIIEKLESEGTRPHSVVSEGNTYEFHCCIKDSGYKFFSACYEWPSSEEKYRTLPR